MSGAALSKQPDAGEAAKIMIRFCGENFEPLSSGALFWPAQNTLLVADLHLEKMSSFAGSGQLLPPYDTGMTLARLEADLQLTGAKKIIALGDSFHRQESVERLHPVYRQRLMRLVGLVDWTWISGNHDPAPHGLGGVCADAVKFESFTLVHEPDACSGPRMCGHLHPSARIRINGRSVRRPCFVSDGEVLMLPAYGASTGTLNILSPAFSGLFKSRDLDVVMIGDKRVYPVSPRHLATG